MSWMDRLRGECEIHSPNGSQFHPLWIGDEISGGKRIGVHEYPDYDGATTQDQGQDPFEWPLTLYFEGEDNDTDSWDFITHYNEKGLWDVYHPVYGKRKLQPVKWKLKAMPVEWGNVTVVTTTWIEATIQPIGGNLDATGQIDSTIGDVGNASAAAAVVNIATSSPDLLARAQAGVGTVLGIYHDALNLVNQANAIYGQIQEGISGAAFDVLSIVGGVQQLLLTPDLILGDIGTKARAWQALLASTLGQTAADATPASRNTIAVAELFAVAAFDGFMQDVSLYDFTTRDEAVQTMASAAAFFDTMTVGLDAGQTQFVGAAIADQYFSQSQSYTSAATLLGLVQRHLLDRSFALKAAKIFTLDRDRNPLEIAITEYGQNGWDEAYYDYFCRTNGLIGKNILTLSAGTEVTIYG